MEANRETISVVLEVSNSSLGGGIWVDVKNFPCMTIPPRISHNALSLCLELVVLTARSSFPLTLQTIVSRLFPLVYKGGQNRAALIKCEQIPH